MSVTFVAGASEGLGRQIAKELAVRGETITAVARRRALLNALVREIEAAGYRAVSVPCDVSDREQVYSAIDFVETKVGPIERVVVCVGGGQRTTIDDFRADQVRETLALNVIATANCIEAVLPRMLARQRGHIVAVSSLAAARGLPGAPEYSAAKAALTTLLEGMRIDLKFRGIDVTILSPGFIHSEKREKSRPKRVKVSADTAVARMVRAIEHRKKTCTFPLWMALVLAMLRCLPPTLADAVVSAIRSRTKFRPQSLPVE